MWLPRASQIYRRTAHTSPTSAWADNGPLYSEHIVFSGSDFGGTTPRLVVFLHGLLGAGRNLRGFAVELFKKVTQSSDATWTAVLLDLRCHGKSSGRTLVNQPPHSLEAAAQDVIRTIANSWPGGIDAVIGHSLGGKVALELARQSSSSLPATMPPPRQVWALDSVPGLVPDPVTGTSAEVLNVLNIVSKIPQPLESRDALYSHLEAAGLHGKMLQQWLGSSLVLQGNKQYRFSTDIPGAIELFKSYRGSEYWDVLRKPPQGTDIHVVKALRGGRWKGSMARQLHEAAAKSDGQTHVHEMPEAGHWLHAEDPKGLASLMAPFLAQLG